MKRKLILSFVALLGVSAAGLGIAVARPQWMPAWARVNPQRLPSWARFGGGAEGKAEEAGLYCKEHGVPEKFCTLCHKELEDKLMLCKEHGNIPEDICTLCHPEVQKKYNIKVCKEHGLPESLCYKCGSTPSASSSDAAPAPVRLASADIARDIGLETAPVTQSLSHKGVG